MSVVGWIVVGFIAGGLARVATHSEKTGCLGTIVIGILGALLGGFLFSTVTGEQTDAFEEFKPGSILVAFVGAAALLLVMRTVGIKPPKR